MITRLPVTSTRMPIRSFVSERPMGFTDLEETTAVDINAAMNNKNKPDAASLIKPPNTIIRYTHSMNSTLIIAYFINK